MSSKKLSSQAPSSARILNYSICPVFVASHVAVELGWLDEELASVGASARYLGSLTRDEQNIAHHQHTLPFQIRDGGNIPPTWSHARGAENVVIGTTGFNSGGQIVVRADSGIYTLADLAGRKLALSRSNADYRADWWRANSEFGLLLLLRLGGLTFEDVELIEIPAIESTAHLPPVSRLSERWPQTKRENLAFNLPEVVALSDGRVDAIFSNQGRSEILEETGRFKVIEDLRRYPDWTLNAPSGPYLITASRTLLDQNPEIAIAFLRASIRAGRWIADNRREAAVILNRVTYQATAEDVLKDIADIDFLPSLSAQNITNLTSLKDFLFEHGYIKNDFEISSWIDGQFLKAALDDL